MAAGEFAGTVRGDQGGVLEEKRDLSEIAVVIPAWQPDVQLPKLVVALQGAGITRIVLVDDGSTADRQPIFEELGKLAGVHVCRHARNLGKGRALKTAFAYALGNMLELSGVVTADADGQHLPGDIVQLARRLASEPDRAVLGVRSFVAGVPFRSRFGNLFTRWVFALITGHKVSDTQTGLRGLPMAILPEIAELPGERYEYETVMLARLCQEDAGPVEVPIQTVYLQGNRGSHFHLVLDSYRVYRALFRFRAQSKRSSISFTSKAAKPHLRIA